MNRRIGQQQRNDLILDRAGALFAKLGYPKVTLKLIAEDCGINRTALYRYYNSKRAIFDQVIIRIAARLGTNFREFVNAHPELSASAKLESLMINVLEIMNKNIGLLDAITEYLIDRRREGESVTRRVRHHTVALRRTLTQLVREGMSNGEFQQMNCNMVGDILFGQLEAAALQLAVAQTGDLETQRTWVSVYLSCLKKK